MLKDDNFVLFWYRGDSIKDFIFFFSINYVYMHVTLT